MLINLLFQQPIAFVFLAIALVISITFHEFAHAYVASRLGDPTARAMGRVSLNPLAHLDPLGTILLLVAGFGWGKPVLFDPSYLRNPKRDAALISIAGPATNFALAIFFALLLRGATIVPQALPVQAVQALFYLIVFYNLILGFFNLIPIHPLDGFKVVNGLLPHELSVQWLQMAPYGIFLLLILIFTNTTGRILDPLLSFSLRFLGLR